MHSISEIMNTKRNNAISCPLKMKNIFLRLLTILTIFTTLYAIILKNPMSMFSSDQISITYLYRDLFFHHGSVLSWNFSAVPYFFPDTLVYFLVAPFFGNLGWQIIITNFFLLSGSYLALVLLGREIAGRKNEDIFRLSGLVTLFLATGQLSGNELLAPILVSHFGSAVWMYLCGLLLILKLLRNAKKWHYCGLIFISGATTFSDPTYFLIFCLPTTIVLSLFLFRAEKTLRLKKIIRCIFIPGLIAFLLNTLNVLQFLLPMQKIFKHAHYHLDLSILSHFKTILELFYQNNMGVFLLMAVFFSVGMAVLIRYLIALIKNKNNFENNVWSEASLFVLLTTVLSMLITLFSIFFDPDLNTPNFVGFRHLYPLIMYPLFLGMPILLIQYSNLSVFVERTYYYFVGGIFFSLVLFYPWQSPRVITDYYSPKIACLDEYLQKNPTMSKNGLSDYWSAHLANLFSKENVNLVAVLPNLLPKNWMSTKKDYLGKPFHFFFITPDSESFNNMITQYGQPNKIWICKSVPEYQIYIYTHPIYLK